MRATAPIQQRCLPLEISARSALVTLETVRITRGCDAESVLNCVGDATHPKFLRWVFNVALLAEGQIRELRFWKDEVLEAAQQHRPTANGRADLPVCLVDKWAEPMTVINKILGNRQSFPRGEIEVQWTINATTISRLVKAGELTEFNKALTRASLADFLQRRLQ